MKLFHKIPLFFEGWLPLVAEWFDLLKSEDCRRLSGNSNSAFRVISRPELNLLRKYADTSGDSLIFYFFILT